MDIIRHKALLIDMSKREYRGEATPILLFLNVKNEKIFEKNVDRWENLWYYKSCAEELGDTN